MIKRKLKTVVLLCCLLIGLNACARYVILGATAAAVGVGSYVYVKGNLKRNYETSLERVWEASLEAVKKLKLTAESKKHDAFDGVIKGKMADGKSFEIILKKISENSTEVGVRVGVFGDREKSETIHDTIAAQLTA